MEERINRIEKELALMAQTQKSMQESLKKISATLDILVQVQTDTKLHAQKINTMDIEIKESFKRVYKRIEKLEAADSWVAKTIIGAFLSGAIALVYYQVRK